MANKHRRKRAVGQSQPAAPARPAQSAGLRGMRESAAEVERELALEAAQGWLTLGASPDDFSRQGLRDLCAVARWYYLKNPLIRCGVRVQASYVMGQGVTIRANDPEVNAVVQRFWDDPANRAELTSHRALMLKEIELTLFGNILFVLFTNPVTGRVRVRTVNITEVDDIVTNPDDSKEPWFYLRSWTSVHNGEVSTQKVAYPDLYYRPAEGGRPDEVRGYRVSWDTPAYHVRTGGLSDMRFGVSEILPAIAWARAYNGFLEDWARLTRALSRFAWRLKAPAEAAGRIGAKLAPSATAPTAPLPGSMMIETPGVELQPVRIGGANVSAEDGRRLLLMVAAALGLPETFFGDASVGTLATAKSLDRPTELRMRDRQELWKAVLGAILGYVVEQAVRAGEVEGQLVDEGEGSPRVELPDREDPQTGEIVKRDAGITIAFPPVLEHDMQARVQAIVHAATLGAAGTPAGTITMETLARALLSELGIADVDAELARLFPAEEAGRPDLERAMFEAVRELRDAVRRAGGQESER